MTGRSPDRDQDHTVSAEVTGRLFDRLAGPDGLTEHASTFARPDVLVALGAGLAGARRTELEELADRFLAERAVSVVTDRTLEERRWSTPGLLAVEQRLVTSATSRTDEQTARVSHQAEREALVGPGSATPLLGPLRRIDRRGGPPGLHDFDADLADGSVAALEVTVEVDDQRLDLAASAERRLSSITLPNSQSLWLVGLAATARVNAIRPDDLRRLLGELEANGRRDAHDLGDYYRDPFVARLRALRIESVCAANTRAGSEGTVMVQAGSYGGWGWDGAAIDRWLSEFLGSDQGKNKLNKLSRAQAAQRHLAVVLDPFSPAGMGIPLGLIARHERGPTPPTTSCPRS